MKRRNAFASVVRFRVNLVCCVCFLGLSIAAAETVAWWRFDEEVDGSQTSELSDSGPNGYFLVVERGAKSVPGKFGNALRPRAPERPFSNAGALPGRVSATATPAADDKGVLRRTLRNVTDSPLNLGAADWTMECWLFVDPDAREEGAIFEIGTGPRGNEDLVTRWSVLPQENAFSFTSISAVAGEGLGGATRRVEYANAEGPPAGVAFVHSTTLALDGEPLPRAVWFHVAVVHTFQAGQLRLYVDGRHRATAATSLSALPHGDHAYVSVGQDGRANRRLLGAIDELRISNEAEYRAEFRPPESMARSGSDVAPGAAGKR